MKQFFTLLLGILCLYSYGQTTEPVLNQTTVQSGSNFNIDGRGVIGTSLGIGTTNTPSSIYKLRMESNVDISQWASIRNFNAGPKAEAIFSAHNNLNKNVQLGITSSGFTPDGAINPNMGYMFSNAVGFGFFNNNPAGFIKFAANSMTENMRINTGGNVLINTTTDDGVNKLQVDGGITATGLKINGASLGSAAYLNANTEALNGDVVKRTADGDIKGRYFSMSAGIGGELNDLTGTNGSDGYVRRYDANTVKAWLGLGSNANSSTAYLPVTGGEITGDVWATSNSQSITWNRRLGVNNQAADRSIFMGVNHNKAILGAHNYALTAWTDLYLNTFDGIDGGSVNIGSGGLNLAGELTGRSGIFNSKIGIGTANPIGKFHIAGAFAGGIMDDGNDRPGVGLSGHYPQAVLMAGGSGNANHGPTVTLGSYDSGTSGANKRWSIGTSGQNSTFLDFGFSTSGDLNPHSGIRNYNGTTVMTLLNSGNVGIGTSNPAYKFETVDNSTSNWSGRVINSTNGSAVYFAHGGGYGMHINTGSNPSANTYALQIYNPNGQNYFYVGGDGNVGVGTGSPDAKLTVKGKIHAEEVKVDLNVPGPDYVFEKDYDLKSLAQVEKFIAENKHLPEIPSAKTMEKDGISMGDMQMKLLQKIEELTLYIIEQNKRADKQDKIIAGQQADINKLKSTLK